MPKNKNRYLPKDLEGFEEVLDLVDGPVKASHRAGGNNPLKGSEKSFALLNFLEMEVIRLEKIAHALEFKNSTTDQIQSKEKLIERQLENQEEILNQLVAKMKSSESIFFRNNSYYFKLMRNFFS